MRYSQTPSMSAIQEVFQDFRDLMTGQLSIAHMIEQVIDPGWNADDEDEYIEYDYYEPFNEYTNESEEDSSVHVVWYDPELFF